MWAKGIQPKRFEFSSKIVNEEILNLDGNLSQEDSKIWLFKFLRNNLGYTAHLFFGIQMYPIQEMIAKSLMIADTCMMVLPRGAGKCSVQNELIHTKKGIKKIIDVNVGDEVQSLYGYNKVEGKTVNHKQKIWEATTSSGYRSGGLDYHRTLTFNPETLDFDWTFSKDLKVGDIIPIRKGFNLWPEENDNIFNLFTPKDSGKDFFPRNRSIKDWYYFFGLMIGDGHYYKRGGKCRGMGLTTGDLEMAEWVARFISDVTNSEYKTPKLSNGENTYLLSVYRESLSDWLISIGFDPNKLAHEKIIPYELLNNSKENICSLMSGLYDADGWASIERREKKNSLRCEVGLCSTSEELIIQVQNILLNLGAESTKSTSFKGGLSKFGETECLCKKAWSLSLNNNSSIRIFNENIKFKLKRKQERLEYTIANQVHGGLEYNKLIPCKDYIRKKYGTSFKTKNGRLELSTGAKSVSRPKLKKLYELGIFDEEDSIKIKKILDLDIYFDKIKEIENREDVTVDIQVANEKCYVSNGFVNHNTWLCAVFLLLQLVFRQGITIGVLSSSFRQSKLILGKAEDILNKPACRMMKGLFTFQKGTDMWTLSCGRSKAIALPLADGSKLRGFRFQIMLIDEFLNMPKNVFTEVLLPFIGVIDNPVERDEIREIEDQLIREGKMTEEERYKWVDNKLILLSSPSFTFEYMYELYCLYRDQILGTETKHREEELDFKDDSYKVIFQYSYECVINQYDKKQIASAKATMSEATFAREYGGQFISESDSYFRLSKMEACTIPEGGDPYIEIAGDPKSEYIISVDPSWSEDEGSDDFAMEVFKLDNDEQKACLVHAYGMAGTNLKKHIFYFHYLITKFNTACVVMDYAGGVQFVSACNESELFKSSGIHLGVIEVQDEFEKQETYMDDIYKFKSELNQSQRKYVFLRKPTSSWIRQANELLQANIDHKRIYFASQPINHDYESQKKKVIPIKDLEWDAKFKKPPTEPAQIVEFLDHLAGMIKLTKTQTSNIEVATNPQGSQTFRLPPHMAKIKGPNKPRKDNYSALVLGNWMAKIYFDSKNASDKPKVAATFTPFFG